MVLAKVFPNQDLAFMPATAPSQIEAAVFEALSGVGLSAINIQEWLSSQLLEKVSLELTRNVTFTTQPAILLFSSQAPAPPPSPPSAPPPARPSLVSLPLTTAESMPALEAGNASALGTAAIEDTGNLLPIILGAAGGVSSIVICILAMVVIARSRRAIHARGKSKHGGQEENQSTPARLSPDSSSEPTHDGIERTVATTPTPINDRAEVDDVSLELEALRWMRLNSEASEERLTMQRRLDHRRTQVAQADALLRVEKNREQTESGFTIDSPASRALATEQAQLHVEEARRRERARLNSATFIRPLSGGERALTEVPVRILRESASFDSILTDRITSALARVSVSGGPLSAIDLAGLSSRGDASAATPEKWLLNVMSPSSPQIPWSENGASLVESRLARVRNQSHPMHQPPRPDERAMKLKPRNLLPHMTKST